MLKMMDEHRCNNQGIISEQVMLLAQRGGQHYLAPSDGQDPDAKLWDLHHELAGRGERSQMFWMTPQQVQGSHRGGQLEPLDCFGQGQAMKHLTQDDNRGDRANLTDY